MKTSRPLSPHLQIYRWRWTMFFSIMHRFTGLILTAGMFFLCIKMTVFAFFGQVMFDEYLYAAGKTIPFKVMKMIFAWAMLYHICQGVRHLIWDVGKLFSLNYGRIGGYTSLIIATGIWLYYFKTLSGYALF